MLSVFCIPALDGQWPHYINHYHHKIDYTITATLPRHTDTVNISLPSFSLCIVRVLFPAD